MILEALVISVCVQGSGGCSQSIAAYYEQSKELKAINERVQRISKELTRENEWVVYVGTPIYALAARKPAKILIYKGTILNIDPWNKSLGFQWNY